MPAREERMLVRVASQMTSREPRGWYVRFEFAIVAAIGSGTVLISITAPVV